MTCRVLYVQLFNFWQNIHRTPTERFHVQTKCPSPDSGPKVSENITLLLLPSFTQYPNSSFSPFCSSRSETHPPVPSQLFHPLWVWISNEKNSDFNPSPFLIGRLSSPKCLVVTLLGLNRVGEVLWNHWFRYIPIIWWFDELHGTTIIRNHAYCASQSAGHLNCYIYFPTSLCGVLVFGCVLPRRAFPPAAPHAHQQLAHTQLVHTQLPHIQLTYTPYSHTTCSHTHNLSTHNLLTHTTCSHTAPVQLVHTHSLLTHNLPTHTLLTHNLLTHNLLTHNLSTHNLLTHNLLTHRHFAWQVWHLWHWLALVTRLGRSGRHGRRGT